jgi:uncharacterized protein (DUF1800 family)
MPVSRRDFFAMLGGVAPVTPNQAGGDDFSPRSPELHVLSRLTWGVTPHDIANIQQMGIQDYIEWQLNPEAIPDPRVDEFMSRRQILSMSATELRRVADEQYGFVLTNMLWGRLFRATHSERQLYERMVEFWTDHFNIPLQDFLTEKTIDDREVIRKHALGNFRDLLFASAQSPAMLMYLDNDVSDKEHPNENYARELMELHTLGVSGGYTEADVKEVARALTGWTIQYGRDDMFVFDMNRHDTGEKMVLGQSLPAGRGIEDGLQVLDILAYHPSTARFIAQKLCRRFIADFPPESIIQSTAEVFFTTGGDIRATMRHLLLSDEFMTAYGQKFRRPIDFVVGTLRALRDGLDVDNIYVFIEPLEGMGQVPYAWNPPNGYPDVAGAWLNTNGLLYRWNVGLNMALAGEGYAQGIALNLDAVIPPANTVGELVDMVAERMVSVTLPADLRQLFINLLNRDGDASAPVDARLRRDYLPTLVGLMIASPQFQWH